MTWATPPTFSDGAVLTGAQLNILRDDLNETAPAKATAAGQIFVATGANAIAARTITSDRIDTSDTTASTTYTNLTSTTGPVVTVTTGTMALVFMTCQLQNASNNASSFAGYAVSGATTIAADDIRAMRYMSVTTTNGLARMTTLDIPTTLTPGSNIFTMQYRTDTGTSTFVRRVLVVVPL